MPSVQNRVALVTGASRGIGKSIALALANAGCHVAVNYHQQTSAAEEVRATIRSLVRETGESLGRKAIAIQADVSIPADVERLVRQTESELGEVEILVNNAGIAQTKPIAEITLADWERILRVNLTSAFLVTQRVLPNMRKRRWGRIINLSSVAAQTGGVIGPHYATSKAGLIGLTHSYAALLAKEGITANAIAPALLETDMVTGNLNATPDRIPLGYFGHPDEAGRAAVLLAESDYITGQTINLNGGWYMS
jgi:Dehydrogenases with different specificities (related to short-chain alcohol dehydrogenases)